jgi:uncharacterized membrane protein
MMNFIRKFLASFIGSLILVGILTMPVVAQGLPEDLSIEEIRLLQEQVNELRGSISDAEAFLVSQNEVTSKEVRARVVEILEDNEVEGFRQMRFIAEKDGERYEVNTADSFTEGLRYEVKLGTDVYLQVLERGGEVIDVFLVDVVRIGSLIFIILLFSAFVVAVGLSRGVLALVGLFVTMLILFVGVLPAILNGWDPVLATAIGGVFILAFNMHLAHGFNDRTFIAFLSTVFGLLLALIFSYLFVAIAKLSGFASEDVILLYFQSEYTQVPSGILLAGIILGAVGVLDDIAINQSETISELLDTDPKMTQAELFTKTMRVGRHHIASTVNTLVLAYAGVALPILLLFLMTKDVGVWRFINDELIAEEIVRTMAGTSALVLTVPFATYLSAWYQKKYQHKHGASCKH